MIAKLQSQYPDLAFSEVGSRFVPRNEDATYFRQAPTGHTEVGRFVKITNPWGGGDTVAIERVEEIHQLARWHQNRVDTFRKEMLAAQDKAAREFWAYPGQEWQEEFQASYMRDHGMTP